MKKLLVAVVALGVLFGMSSSAMAQSKIVLSVGGDLLLPIGSFGDSHSIGFGGSARGQYNITPMAAVGLTVGYFTWSGKDVTVGGTTQTGIKFSGIPIRVFGKYYFMPETEKVRVYGIAELGFMIASIPDQTIPGTSVTVGGVTVTSPARTIPGASETDFNYAPGVGAEFALGSGTTKLDVSVRYDGISAGGGSAGNLGARVGVNFPLGN